MSTPDRTQALLEDLARALGLAATPRHGAGGARLTLGGAVEIRIYEEDADAILVVSPIGPLPNPLGHAAAASLLRDNLFTSDCAPFVIAADETGTLMLWGRLWIADLDGDSLAGLVEAVASKVADIRHRLSPPVLRHDMPP